jgi:hypothetical protein
MRDMLSDELVEAMESLHQYPRLIAERAAKEASRAALAALRAEVEGLDNLTGHMGGLYRYAYGQVFIAIDRALGDG